MLCSNSLQLPAAHYAPKRPPVQAHRAETADSGYVLYGDRRFKWAFAESVFSACCAAREESAKTGREVSAIVRSHFVGLSEADVDYLSITVADVHFRAGRLAEVGLDSLVEEIAELRRDCRGCA